MIEKNWLMIDQWLINDQRKTYWHGNLLLSISFDFQQSFELFVGRIVDGRKRHYSGQGGRITAPQTHQTRIFIWLENKFVRFPETEGFLFNLKIDLRPIQWSNHSLGHGTCSRTTDQRCHDVVRVGELRTVQNKKSIVSKRPELIELFKWVLRSNEIGTDCSCWY